MPEKLPRLKKKKKARASLEENSVTWEWEAEMETDAIDIETDASETEVQDIGTEKYQDEHGSKAKQKLTKPVPKKRKSDKIQFELSIEDLVESVSIPCIRGNISAPLQTGIVASILNKAYVDINKVVFSTTTVSRIRNEVVSSSAAEYKEKIIQKFKGMPLILNFDNKKINETTSENIPREIERLAVSGTSLDPNVVEGLGCEDDELLGVIEAESGKDRDQAIEIYNLVLSYGLEDEVIGVCTDTTCSNMGKYNGAITLLEQNFGRSLLWLMCRRHSSETHISHAMEVLTGVKTKGPRCAVYVKLQKLWLKVHESVKKLDNLVLFDWKKHRGTVLGKMAEDSLQYCTRVLATKVFMQCDYKKIAEKNVVYLGGKVDNFTPAQPMACHEARFAADSLYLLMLQMTSKILDVLSVDEQKWIESAADIVAAIHAPHFLKSTVIVKAAKMILI